MNGSMTRRGKKLKSQLTWFAVAGWLVDVFSEVHLEQFDRRVLTGSDSVLERKLRVVHASQDATVVGRGEHNRLPRLRWIGAKSAKQLSSTAERHHCAMRPGV